MKRLFVTLSLLLIAALLCQAENFSPELFQYRFSSYTIEEGLSNNKVNAVCGDKFGFVWFGTNEGVNKFDGYSSEVFKNDPGDSTSISHSVIRSIFTDSKHRIWIGTQKGLNLYDPAMNHFIRIKDSANNSAGLVWSICEDSRGVLWIGGRRGLFYIEPESTILTEFATENEWFVSTEVTEVFAGSEDVVLIGARDEGLYIYHYLDASFQKYSSLPNDNSTLSENWIEAFYEDSLGNFWIGTRNGGLSYFDYQNRSFTRYEIDPKIPENRRVRDIVKDNKGRLWFGTHQGLYLKTEQNQFVRFAHMDNAHSRLTNNSIYDIYIDEHELMWLGTYAGGVNFTDLNQKRFHHIAARKGNENFLNDDIVYAIVGDAENNLWIGTEKGGINLYDREEKSYRYFMHDPDNPNSLGSDNIKAISFDKAGNAWVGTYLGGLSYLRKNSNSFINYRHNPDDESSIISDNVYVLLFDNEENLWIGTGNGLDVLRKASSRFLHYDQQSGEAFGFRNDIIRSLYQDSRGDIWAGTNHVGVYKLDKEKNSFIPFKPEQIDMGVFTICEDKNGKLWMGGNNGLFYIDTYLDSIIYYSEKEGLPAKTIYRIIDDNKGNLWLSTTNGISKFVEGVHTPHKPNFRNYDTEDGLQSRHFMYNCYNKFESGEIMFGGVNGFNLFMPNEIVDNPYKARVFINGLRIFNKDVNVNEHVKGVEVLQSTLLTTDELKLSYKHYVFSIGFVALQMARPENNSYAYFLEGFEEEWNYTDANHRWASYTNLPAGEYTFKVKAANYDGLWNEDPATLKIIIVPPFWKTWWFRFVLGISLAFLVLVIYYYRNQSVRNRNRELEKTVRKRTLEISEKSEEISAQKEELEQHRNKLESLVKERTASLESALAHAKESDELKSAFLANMSHEIRTPMNAISGFANLLNDKGLSQAERDHYNQIIQSNSDDLLRIIDEILDMSLIESNQLKINKELFEFNEMIDLVYSLYEHKSELKLDLRKKNSLEKEQLKFESDGVRLKQILINLMDNACKYTEKGYVEIGAYRAKNNIHIYVKDSGRGIPADKIDSIFQHFTKVDHEESKWTRGLGLGLAISQNIAKAMGGKISVESEFGKGSTFTLSLPGTKILARPESSPVETQESPQVMWRGKTILIAEDVEENFILLNKILNKTGSKVLWAKNGEEAFKMAVENSDIDIILMDIKMPVINGYEATKMIKEQNPGQIVIAQTAYARAEEKLNFYDNNFDEYVSKPIKADQLFTVLNKFLQ